MYTLSLLTTLMARGFSPGRVASSGGRSQRPTEATKAKFSLSCTPRGSPGGHTAKLTSHQEYRSKKILRALWIPWQLWVVRDLEFQAKCQFRRVTQALASPGKLTVGKVIKWVVYAC